MARSIYFFAFVALLPTALCCGGMEITLESVDTICSDGTVSVFQISPEFGLIFGDNCIIQPRGCAEITKDVDGAKVKVSIESSVLPKHEGEYDGCQGLKNASKIREAQEIMKIFNLPSGCPMKKEKLCAEGQTIDISKYAGHLMFVAGTVILKSETTHNDGSKSCFNAEVKVTPKN